jgi:hypothetical protein
MLTADGANLLAPRYQRAFIATMFCVCFFNFADRAVFAVLAQTIKCGFAVHCPANGSMARMAGAMGDACRHASMEGVRDALMIAVCVLFVAGCFYFFAARTVRVHQYDPNAKEQLEFLQQRDAKTNVRSCP